MNYLHENCSILFAGEEALPGGAAVGVDRTLYRPPLQLRFPLEWPVSGRQEAQYRVAPGPIGPEHVLALAGVFGLHHASGQQPLHRRADAALVYLDAQLPLELSVVVRTGTHLDGLFGGMCLDDPIDDPVVEVVVGHDQLLLPCYVEVLGKRTRVFAFRSASAASHHQNRRGFDPSAVVTCSKQLN